MEEKSNLEGAWSLAAPGIVMFPFVLCITLSFAYSSESHPALKPSSRVFSPWRQTFDIRETGPGRWCWHLIYILWPGQGGRTECCMHARDSTQQPRASSHPMRDWGLQTLTECRIDTNLNWLALGDCPYMSTYIFDPSETRYLLCHNTS